MAATPAPFLGTPLFRGLQFPNQEQGATHWLARVPVIPMVKAEFRAHPSMLGVSEATRFRSQNQKHKSQPPDHRRRSAAVLPGFFRTNFFFCAGCSLGQLLLSCVHNGHQIVRLWLVSGPQLVRPGCQAPDVTWLLLSEQSPQSNRQSATAGTCIRTRVGQHAGQHLGRLPATQILGLEEHIQLLVVRKSVALQKTSKCHTENLPARYRPQPWPGPKSSQAWPPEEDCFLVKLALGRSKLGPRPGQPERWQDDRLLLQLLGVAMSRQGPPLLQEDEDDKDGDDDRINEIQVLHAAHCKSRVTTVEEQKQAVKLCEDYI